MGTVADLIVKECKSSEFLDCDIVFSGLDANIAGDVGMFDPLALAASCFSRPMDR